MADGNTLDTISLELKANNSSFNKGIAKSISALKHFQSEVNSTTKAVASLNNVMGKSSAAVGSITKVANAIGEVNKKLSETTTGKMSADDIKKRFNFGGMFKGVGEGFKTMGKGFASLFVAMNPATLIYKMGKSLGFMLGQMKRVAMYRLFRTMIKGITQALDEGKDNLYRYSKAVDTAFYKNMDKIATAGLYFKNSIGAMISPIINTIAPIIDMIVDKIVDALNFINRTIAELTGAATWTRALKYETQYKDGLDDANGSAKKLKATILGIDEINPLNDNSSGGRGAADAMDYSKMFEEVATSGKKSLNDLIKGFDAKKFGKDLGKKISGAIRKVSDYISEIDFTEIGKKVAQFIEGINWVELLKNVGKLIWNGIVASWNLVTGALSESPILSGLIIAVSAIAKSGIGAKIAGAVSTSFAGVTGSTIFAGLAAALAGFSLGNWLYNNVPGIRDFADNLIGFFNQGWASFRENFVDGWKDALDNVKTTFSNFFYKMQNMWNEFWREVNGIELNYHAPSERTDMSKLVGGTSNTSSTTATASASSSAKKLASNMANLISTITPRAEGGFVNSGEMFLARENGMAEYVGAIGNRTAVANNEQIVSAVASGVASASAVEVQLLREQNSLLSRILAKDNSVVVSANAISNGLARQNRITGTQTVALG